MKRAVLLFITVILGTGLGAYCQNPIMLTVTQPDPLQADAGTDVEIGKGESISIGGNPSALDGYGDYIYSWAPATGLNDPTLANPIATPESTTIYLLQTSLVSIFIFLH